MNTTTVSLSNIYSQVLSTFPTEIKLSLISALSDSMRQKRHPKNAADIDKIFSSFNEDWGGSDSPMEIANSLRAESVKVRSVEA